MVKKLICYTFENLNSIKRKQFDRKLFGTKEKTHGGKYFVETKGYLSDKIFRKPVKSTILINKSDEKEVLKILKQFSAKIEVFTISSN